VNLGIVWGGYTEVMGGGYTFTMEVLSALERAKLPDGWRLTLLCMDDQPVPKQLEKWNRRTKDVPKNLQRLWRRFLAKFGKNKADSSSSGAPTFSGQPLNEIVDAVVFTFPGYFECPDVPQVSVVWDLSHRNVSFLPEISHRGQREVREKHFAMLTKHADKLITGTERGAWEISHYYGFDPANIWRIPHPTPFSPANVQEVKPETAPRAAQAIYPAQFWAHKNHITLLKAWRQLADTMDTPPKLVLVGKDYGNEAWVRKKTVQLGVEHLIDFRGFIPRGELLSLYKSAGVLVYPSIFGPENLPPLEAMSLGCPVILANYPGAKEQCGDAALYVEPLDSYAWAEAVRTVLGDRELTSRLRALGQKRAQSFTADDFANSLLLKLKEFADLRALWRLTEDSPV
jgi:glycosyltransferase involved in cell wall biosynthesis